jgi:hypothetical protein
MSSAIFTQRLNPAKLSIVSSKDCTAICAIDHMLGERVMPALYLPAAVMQQSRGRCAACCLLLGFLGER